MSYYVVVLDDGRASVVTVPAGENPNGVGDEHVVLNSYSSMDEAQERCDIENDPAKREQSIYGKLKVQRSKSA